MVTPRRKKYRPWNPDAYAHQAFTPVDRLPEGDLVFFLLDTTLVVWASEFGRTPMSQGGKGRDHNPYGFTMWLAGGGVQGGQAVGATDEFGLRAVKDRISVHDFHATILHLLGLDHERLTYRYAGRDFRLTDVEGRVVRAALA